MERMRRDTAMQAKSRRAAAACAVCALLLCAVARGSDYDIIINEINYRPLVRGEGGEFIELLNRGPVRIDLSAWRIEGDAELAFSPGTALDPGEYLIACGDPAAFGAEVEASRVHGPWRGSLGDAGGIVAIRRPDGLRVAFVHYKHDDQWPALADGGATLELNDPYAEIDLARSWHASAALGGTPGGPNGAPSQRSASVRINELGATAGESWVELQGPDGWSLEGCALALGPRATLRQTLHGLIAGSFACTRLELPLGYGEACLLFLASDGTTLLDCMRVPPLAAGTSAARIPDGANEVLLSATPTPGAPNTVACDDSLYISEIMYHPVAGDPPREDVDREYVAVANRGAASADLSGWSLGGGIEFVFPEGAIIAPGQEVVVARTPAAFTAAYPGIAGVFGGFRGRLADDSETLVLRDSRGAQVDRVTYGDDGAWPAAADGGGAALVLATAAREIDNAYGAAWRAAPGDPGVAPAQVVIPPCVVNVAHDPPVPAPDSPVRIACRIMSVESVVTATLTVKPDGGEAFSVAMERQGGSALDARWEAHVGPFAQGAVVAFGVRAEIEGGGATDAPGPGKNFLFAVDGSSPPVPRFPSWRIVMTESSWQELNAREPWSNVLLDATFIGDGGEIRYNVGVRFRGSTSRSAEHKNYHVSLQSAAAFQGMTRIDLNRQNTDSQIISMDLLKRAGLPYSQEWFVNLWLHGEWDAQYLRVEVVGEELLRRCFGEGNETGSLYRGWEIEALGRSADFTYLGADPEVYRALYENVMGDWAGDSYEAVMRLCGVFSPELTPDAEFSARIAEAIDVDEWLLFFAVQACLSNDEGNLAKDKGDDYFVYFRPGDGRAVLVPWDFDSSFASSAEPLFRPTIPAVQRLLCEPAFAPRYYDFLAKLMDGPFARYEMRRRMALIADNHEFQERDDDETFVTERLGFLDAHVPRHLAGGVADAGGRALIARGDSWRYFKGSKDPSGGDLRWTRMTFDDASWPEGPSGFGYGDGDDETVLGDMQGGYFTVFIRRRFEVPDPAAIERLVLRIDYDDGFSAFLNGQPVARRNVAAGIPRAVWAADVEREAGVPEEIDLTQYATLLQPGANILAIVGVNEDLGSGDFSLIPELLARSGALGAGGEGEDCIATGENVSLRGTAPAARTHAVTIDDAPADYNPVRGVWEGAAALAPGPNRVRVRAYDAGGELLEELALVVTRLSGVTPLGGMLAADTTLTRAQSPYVLERTLTVPAGMRLTIDPGVLIVALGGVRIECAGLLEALGEENAPIRFVSAFGSDPWCGIGVHDTGIDALAPVHVLRHCVFRTGRVRAGIDGLLDPFNARVLVEKCHFEAVDANAIDGRECVLEVRDCAFETVYEGVHCVRSAATVLHSSFRHMRGDRDAIDFDEEGPGPCRIEGCTIDGGMDDGIDLLGTTCAIVGNTILRCQDRGIACEGEGVWGHTSIEGNVIARNGTGVAVRSGAHIEAGGRNTIVANQEGVACYAKDGAADGGHAAFHSSIVWHNERDAAFDSFSTLQFAYSDVGGDALWPGAGNIAADPRFADEAAAVFLLAGESPCLGAGLDGVDMGALGRTADTRFVRGEANGDGRTDIADVVFVLSFLFAHGAAPACADAADANDSGRTDIADAIALLAHLFAEAGPLPAPGGACGADPTAAGLACEPYVRCP